MDTQEWIDSKEVRLSYHGNGYGVGYSPEYGYGKGYCDGAGIGSGICSGYGFYGGYGDSHECPGIGFGDAVGYGTDLGYYGY